jgi:hypothetical protein
MKYLKLFEEMNRILVTVEEKVKLKQIVKKIIQIVNDKRFAGGIKEKAGIEYDLAELKTIVKNSDYDTMQHRNDGYKMVDSTAKQLSKMRGIEVVFDRKDNCFKTKSGKAYCVFEIVSKIDVIKEQNPCFINQSLVVFINYKTGDIINDLSGNKKVDANYIRVWDFTGARIYMPIGQQGDAKDGFGFRADRNRNIDIFSIAYHEFTHAKDPKCWIYDNTYATPDMIKNGSKGKYASNQREIQTMCNNLLEILGYYFERTWRGDTDGGGFNYNLTRDEVLKNFIPTISEVRDFINGKRDDLSIGTKKQLSGDKKTTRFIDSVESFIKDIKREAPDKMEFVKQWMKDDFLKLIDTYNKKIVEINKKKSADLKLPPLMVTPLKSQ